MGRDDVAIQFRAKLQYRIALACLAVLGPWSSASAFTANLAANPVPNGGDFSLTWSNPAGYEYDLHESSNGGASWTTLVTTLATTYSISGRSAGTYKYRVHRGVRTCTGFPEPTCTVDHYYSETLTVAVQQPPAVPSGLSVPANDYNGNFQVSWNSVGGATDYYWQERPGGGSWSTAHATSVTNVSISGKSPNTYKYRVKACSDPNVCSNYSAVKTVTVVGAPPVPTGLQAPSEDFDGTVPVSWNAVGGASTYKIRQVGPTTRTYTVSSTSKTVNLPSTGSYSFKVKSCNPENVCSSYSASVSTEFVPPPTAPAGLSGPDISESGTYTISWDPVSDSTGYELQEKIAGGSWPGGPLTPEAGTSKNFSSKSPDTYVYRVVACNAEDVCGPWSGTHDVTVPEPPAPPSAWFPTDASDFPDAPVVIPFVPSSDDGMNSVGALRASSGVSGGSAGYRVPIAIPPGRKGMQPDVSLSYSSSGGNGVVGIGWRLNAGSAITRCAATPAQDDFTAGIQYDASRDRLCLDGRRLVVTGGIYGQSGAQYRTELDSFVRITQNGSLNQSSTWFTAEFKSGRTSRFGTSSGSRHSAAGRTEVLIWAIEETQDRSGNTITYDYADFGGGEYHLSAIHYTGKDGSDGNRQVRFSYADRVDKRTSFLAGGKTRSTRILSEIETEYQDTLIRRYRLNYGNASASTGRSLLRSIEECAYNNGGVEHCLPETQLQWAERATDYEAAPLTFLDPDFHATGSRNGDLVTVHEDKRWLHDVLPHGDANGDGVKDWTHLFVNAEGVVTGENGGLLANCFKRPGSWTLTCLEADFNTDGLTDSFRERNGNFEIRFAGSMTWFSTGVAWNRSAGAPIADTPLGFADFNGDGWIDLAIKQDSKLWVYFHTQNLNNPYSNTSRQWLLDYPASGSGTTHAIDVQIYGDMDGNGTPDFVVSSVQGAVNTPGLPVPGYILETQSEPGGTMTTSTRSIPSISDNEVKANFLHDINGDGLTDVLALLPGTKTLGYQLNDGTQFSGTWIDLGIWIPTRSGMYQGQYSEPTPYTYPVMSKILTADYDGNGIAEILFADAVLASGCSEVFDVNGPVWHCDDDLYGDYQALPYSNYQSPMNSSVKDNSVRRYKAHRFDEDANGNIVATTFTTDIVASASQTAVIDATGDGLPDVVTVLGCRLTGCEFNLDTAGRGGITNSTYEAGAWINRNVGAADPAASGAAEFPYAGYDLMTAAESGLGVRDEWTYRPLSSDEYNTSRSDFYDVTHAYQQSNPDYFHFASSMYVVADHRRSNGVGGLNSTKYRYRGAIFNNKGRGFQGFRSIIAEIDAYAPTDPLAARDTISRTDFHQKWPLSSETEQACTWIAADNVADDNPACQNVLSHEVVDQLLNVPTAGGARFVAVKKRTKQTFDLQSGALLVTSVVDRTFDSAGNVTHESRSHDDAWTTSLTESTRNYATHDWSGWWLDQLTSAEVTHNPVSQRHASSPIPTASADSLKRVTTTFNQYDSLHRLPTSVTVSANDSPLTQTVTTTYNPYGLPKNVSTTGTDVTGPRTIDTTYTGNGTTQAANGYFPFTVTNALGHATERKTDPGNGQTIQVTDLNGLVSTTTYDAFGRQSEITPSGQPSRSIRYHWCGTVSCPAEAEYRIASYAAGAPESHSFVDKLGREVRASVRNFADTDFIHVSTAYDNRGYKSFESVPWDPSGGETGVLGTRYLGHDALGRLLGKEQDQANGTVLATSYSHSGLTTTIYAGGLPPMSRTYNGLGQLVETLDAEGGITRYAYDGAGNPVVLRDVLGNDITASFNALGHKRWVDDPNMGLREFTYNALGEVLSETDANNDTVTTEYDVLGRLVERRVNGTLVGSWHYDNPAPDKGLGLLDYADSHPGTGGHGLQTHYVYADASTGRKAIERTVHRLYQSNPTNATDYETRYYTDSYYGRPKGLRYPGGVGVEYVYNGSGYVTQETDASSSYVIRTISALDSRNNVIQGALSNGTLLHSAAYAEASGQLGAITVTGPSGTVHGLSYSYDSYGNLATRTTNYAAVSSSESLYYDDLQRLIQSIRSTPAGTATVNYGYDAAGNLTLKDDYASSYSYAASRPNAVASITTVGGGTMSFGYDANGNLTSQDDQTAANIDKTLTYTAFNKPATITAGGMTATFHYGADLARFRQAKSNRETILYVGKHMEIVTLGSTADYRHYLGETAILTKTGDLNDPTPAVRYLLRDRLGSVVTVTDEAGAIVEVRGYDPFGKPRDGDWAEKTPPVLNSSVTGRGFTDHEHLDESGLIHMNGRAYDYNLGRFLSVDPIIQAPGNSQSLNPYSYIMNNPLSGTDPSGFAACGETIGKGDVCQIETEDEVSVPGSRLTRTETRVFTVAHNGVKPFIVEGADRKAFDELESQMAGDPPRPGEGTSLRPIPFKIGERTKSTFSCINLGLFCETEQFLIDPTEPGFLAKLLGDAWGSFFGAADDGYSYNPWTGRVLDNPVETRVNTAIGLFTLALPGPKSLGMARKGVPDAGPKLGDLSVAKGQRGAVGSRRAPEFRGGRVSESGFLDAAEDYLGPGYKSLPNGRYVSADGLRQVRYGKHETSSKLHHGHFEAYDKPGGRVIENTMVEIHP